MKHDDVLLTPLDWVLPDHELTIEDKQTLLRIGGVKLWTSRKTNIVYAMERDLQWLASDINYHTYFCRLSDNPRIVFEESGGDRRRYFSDAQTRYAL